MEKYLKALYVQNIDIIVPHKYNLSLIAKRTGVNFTDEQIDFLDEVTDFNLEARYPKYKKEFRKRATKSFTKTYLDKIKEFKEWIKTLIEI